MRSAPSLEMNYQLLCNLDKLYYSTTNNHDGTEVCELAGCYILKQLSTVMRKELLGLYRDDGLGIMKEMSGAEIE